ncbi:hypothetical protein RUM43_007828 [Polyplax serrata]|uniref:Uncharacterized protein n=1 Tax=Polyplax serrata TaxID=468196 RepID=A0AAN8S5S1_POLSC
MNQPSSWPRDEEEDEIRAVSSDSLVEVRFVHATALNSRTLHPHIISWRENKVITDMMKHKPSYVEYMKTIPIKIIEEGAYEKNAVFYVHIGEPKWIEVDIKG